MQNDGSDALPTMPLDYFDRGSGAWLPIVRILCWVGIIHSAAIALNELAFVGLYLFTKLRTSTVVYDCSGPALAELFPSIGAIVLMVGCWMSLRFRRGARSVVIWASAAMIVCWIVSFGITEFEFARITWSLSRRETLAMEIEQTAGSFFFTLADCIVPAMLWVVFRRQEMRGLSGE